MRKSKPKFLVTKNEVIEAYLRAYKKHGKVSFDLLKDLGVNRCNVRTHFKNIDNLHSEMREEYPNDFNEITLKEAMSNQNIKSILSQIKGCKIFVVTTAVMSGKVHIGFYNSIKNYCNIRNGKLLLEISSNSGNKGEMIDSVLSNEIIVREHIHLNKNLTISPIKINSKSVDPLTGLERISQKHGSSIYASPKQRLKFVPINNVGIPRAIMTTGAITIANYKAKTAINEKSTLISDADHVLGAIIVEVQDDRIFHFRQIQADSQGHFIDLGLEYGPTGKPQKILGSTFIPGDLHGDSADPGVIECFKEMSKKIDFDKIVVHDIFDGKSVNPHELDDIILRSQRAEKGELNLRDEIKRVVQDIDTMLSLGKQLVIVASNHDAFLERYLKEGLYVKDPQNHRLCLDIACRVMDGENALKAATEIVNGRKVSGTVKWLKIDEDYKIAGCQMGAHGHLGPSGTKGTLKGMELAYNNCFTAHTHAAQILRNAWCTGTSTFLQLSYNFGPSAWTNTAGVLYPNGNKQLLHVIFNQWRLVN